MLDTNSHVHPSSACHACWAQVSILPPSTYVLPPIFCISAPDLRVFGGGFVDTCAGEGRIAEKKKLEKLGKLGAQKGLCGTLHSEHDGNSGPSHWPLI